MNQDEKSSDHFELADFVLGYLEQQESIVTPPAYGVHEALLPDELAADLGLDSYQIFSFTGGQSAEHVAPDEEITQLGINHPLVDDIAQCILAHPANACVYINHVRLVKQGLLDLAQKSYKVPNARITAKADATQGRALHHYLRFNFKVALLSDEKRELMVAVTMDVQGGRPVRDAELLKRLDAYASTSAFEGLPIAPPQWRTDPDPLATDALNALFARAEAAVREDLHESVAALQARTARHLELDRARIEGYYGDLERDLGRRLERMSGGAGAQRRTNAEEKLAALHAERQTKLAHLAARHQVRMELELINLLLIVQPKLRLPVTVGNRTLRITRTAVWDPLMHHLELLNCDVCGQQDEELYLCISGHLAHKHCLTCQCIDCSRVYCQQCSDQIDACTVCHEPVCQRSLITCPTCGRGTCRDHQNLCHAADGQPVDLATLQPAPSPPAPKPEPAPTSTKPPKEKPVPRVTRQTTRSAQKRAHKPPARKGKPTKAVRIHVEIYEEELRIVAHVMRSTNRTWAVRTFQLNPQGIYVDCQCEKSDCSVHDHFYRPAPVEQIAQQLEGMFAGLRQEYLTPAKKMIYYYIRSGRRQRESQVFMLPSRWRDHAMIRAAQRGFDNL